MLCTVQWCRGVTTSVFVSGGMTGGSGLNWISRRAFSSLQKKACPVPNVSFTVVDQQYRHKGHILPHKKPRWIPPAPSKKFKLPPTDHTPEAETTQINFLKLRYKEHLSGVAQYLYEDFKKYSDTGEAAQRQAELDAKEHTELVKDNEAENQRIATLRTERLKREMAEKKGEIAQELEEFSTNEKARLERAKEVIMRTEAAMAEAVKPDQLEKAIEEALANPVDYEFAIDTQGHIYRGRYTKSVEVPPALREKLKLTKNPYDFLKVRLEEKEQEA